MKISSTGLSRLLRAIVIGIAMLGATGAHSADDSAALSGLKDGKIAFDIKEGNGKLLMARLDIIDETRQSLIKQGVTPHFILAFRGPATKLVQTDQEKIKPEDREMAAKIAARIKEMSKARRRWFGLCAMPRANRKQDRPGATEIRVVGNGFIPDGLGLGLRLHRALNESHQAQRPTPLRRMESDIGP
jgi:hypothetical protein